MNDLLIRNIGLLATAVGTTCAKGAAQGQIQISKDCCIAIDCGTIVYVGDEKNAPTCRETLDAEGRLVTPGLVDGHTHLVFGGWRDQEFARKLRGDSYLEILRSGGGILSTVRATRAASEEALYDKAFSALNTMLQLGTTACEAKSGYGLDLETEMKQLRVIRALGEQHPMADIVPTYLGAHAVPAEYKDRADAYVDFMCEEVIPAVAAQKLAEYCDVFCETGVFNVAQSRRVLECGRRFGLKSRIHADEIDAIGGGELAGELHTATAEHLIAATPNGIRSMAAGNVIACLLPATSFYLDKPFAPARAMVEAGIPVAICTDYNPGSTPNLNLQLAMNIGCLRYKLSPEETLTAATLNGAAAIGRADRLGTAEVGKQADLLLWDAESLEEIFYRYGHNQVRTVLKRGVIQRF